MKESPEAVYLIIPLMKELGMRWDDIKQSPRNELEGLLFAYGIISPLFLSYIPRKNIINLNLLVLNYHRAFFSSALWKYKLFYRLV